MAGASIAAVYAIQHWIRRRKQPAPRRYGAVIRLKPGAYLRYRQLHDKVWPQVLERMYQSNIRNFTIYYHKETGLLFQHFEWIGHWKNPRQDEAKLFQRDMEAIANDPVTRDWWKECEPCQEPVHDRKGPPPSEGGRDDWWSPMECVAQCGYWPVVFEDAASSDPDFRMLCSKQNNQQQ